MEDDRAFISWDPEFWDPVLARCAEILNAWFDEQLDTPRERSNEQDNLKLRGAL